MEMNTNPAVGTEPDATSCEKNTNKNEKTTPEGLQCDSGTSITWPREAVELIERYNNTRRELSIGAYPGEYTLADHREDSLNEIVGLMAVHPEITQIMLARAQAGQKALEAEQELMNERIGRKHKK